MNSHPKLAIVLATLLFAVSTVGCSLSSSLSYSKPVVSIGSPAHGAQLNAGQEVLVQATAFDSSGINRIELWVDGALNTMAQPPAPQAAQTSILRWLPTAPGTHMLLVRAINLSNVNSDPAAVTVTVVAGNVLAPTPALTSVPAAIQTATPSPTSPATCTSDAAFVEHVTVPDGTNWAPGQAFNKIWRVRNAGTCEWGPGYELVFVGGEAMTTQSTIAAPVTAPGATADLLVAMIAPTTPGTHTGQWRLRNSTTGLFGATFGVTINVLDPAPAQGTGPSAQPPSNPGCPLPDIASFDANPALVAAGQVSTLTWGLVSNANSAVIDQGIGGVPTPGSKVVTVNQTTTFTLTATGCGGTVAKQVTITVNVGAGQANPASGTCMSGYVWREASPTDKVCVTPAARAQAQADNAAAASRKLLNYGPDSCKQGYVWREAFPGDHVCVTADVRAQAASDNAAAASRKMLGYGPDSCKQGYVWREAFPGDHVCVTGGVRSQAAADNAAAASRWVSGWYGPHSCVQGFVWREARSGDDVCVTGAVRTQTANDNAAAASRVDSAPYGPDTCKVGYVWREAKPDDHVCVTAAVRAQAAADNAAAASRKEVGAYGPDTCKQGYVWREAWSGDHVCVTGQVRSQVAADNAAAPSHTYH